MPLEMHERVESRRQTTNYLGQTTSIEFQYTIIGTADEVVARDHLHANIADDYDLCDMVDAAIEPLHIDEANEDNCSWTARVKYAMQDTQTSTPGEYAKTFDTTGGTQHITHAKATTSYAAAGKTATDFKGAINVVQNGGQIDVQGVDLVVRQFNWSEEHAIASSAMPWSAIYSLTGKVNSASFRGYAAGEVLFLGASGNKDASGKWLVTFSFTAIPNVTNLTTITGITVASKKGHEYLWVSYAQTEDATAGRLSATPIAAYVQKVYDEGDLNGLGI